MHDELRTERVLACLLVFLVILGFARQYARDPHEPWLIPVDELPVRHAAVEGEGAREWRNLVNGGRMDVNQVTAHELRAIPGVGPSLAQNIIEYREVHGPITRLENLQSVRGIGLRTLHKIRPFLTIGNLSDAGHPVAPSP